MSQWLKKYDYWTATGQHFPHQTIDALIDIASGATDYGVIVGPYDYIVRDNGGVYEAINSGGQLVYGGTDDAGDPTPVDGSSFDDVMNAAVADGTHIFVKPASSALTWNIDLVPANKIIESNYPLFFVIKHTSPDTGIISVGANTLLLKFSAWDKTGLDLGLSPNEPRPCLSYYNGRGTATNLSHWYRQQMVVDIGETGGSGGDCHYDRPGIAVNQHGPGDAFYAGIKDDGVGFRCDVDYGAPSKIGIGFYAPIWGAGSGVEVVAKSGAAGYGVLVGQEADVPALYCIATVPTTNDITHTSNAKTTGSVINLYQSTSTFTGNGLTMNFGVSGTFNGKYLSLIKNNVEKIHLDADGDIAIVDKAKGLVLQDRVTNDYYRLYVSSGVLHIESY